MTGSAGYGREQVALTQEKETLLIPLYSKAVESSRAAPILVDEKAAEILARLDYDFAKLRVPVQSRITVAMRAKKLDEWTRQWLEDGDAGDAPVVLHLGSGLDSRVARVGSVRAEWYDVDHPETIELRRLFYEETPSRRMIGASVTDSHWMDAIPGGRPAMIVAEGLLMYLDEREVRDLLLRLRERFPGSQLAFDAFSAYAARRMRRHPSIRQTEAVIKWGIDDPRAIETWSPGIRLLEEWFFSDSTDIAGLGMGLRLMFALTRRLPSARRAHRLLRYQL